MTIAKTKMLHLLKRHFLPIKAHFDYSLVLTYALPQEILRPLLSPGLTLDTFGDYGFVAIAMVQTRQLRPTFLPALVGQDFFLTGYRIFTRYQSSNGKHLRGLQILRSDTDKAMMVKFGNLMTGYHYSLANIEVSNQRPQTFEIKITTPKAEADLHICADISQPASSLPISSPFKDHRDARKFAGPLPHTFSYEKATNSMVIVRGLREAWEPMMVDACVLNCTFFNQPKFCGVTPVLASAFYIANIPYRWERGVVSKGTIGVPACRSL